MHEGKDRNRTTFPVTVSTECKTIGNIYPQKQRQVSEIYDLAKRFPIIRRIIVFGSSVREDCRTDSDLDLCVDADVSDGMQVFEMQKAIGEICGWNCDILMYVNLGNSLRETVRREGVVIYEQPA